MPELIMIFIILPLLAIFAIVPFWLICKKAGLSPWLSLIMIVPFGAFVLPFVLAFIDWPALRNHENSRL